MLTTNEVDKLRRIQVLESEMFEKLQIVSAQYSKGVISIEENINKHKDIIEHYKALIFAMIDL